MKHNNAVQFNAHIAGLIFRRNHRESEGQKSTTQSNIVYVCKKPKSAGRGESVTSTDGVAMTMELVDEMDTEGRERRNCCGCYSVDLFVSYEMSLEGE